MKTILIFVTLCMLALDANAQTVRCSTYDGVTSCRGSGVTVRGTTDQNGTTRLRDSNGNRYQINEDASGYSTVKRNGLTTHRGYTDAYGTTRLRSRDGSSIRIERSPYSGSRVTCRTDINGNIKCR